MEPDIRGSWQPWVRAPLCSQRFRRHQQPDIGRLSLHIGRRLVRQAVPRERQQPLARLRKQAARLYEGPYLALGGAWGAGLGAYLNQFHPSGRIPCQEIHLKALRRLNIADLRASAFKLQQHRRFQSVPQVRTAGAVEHGINPGSTG